MNFPQQLPKKRTPVWVWIAAVFGAMLVVGMIGNAVDGGKKDAAPVAAVASAAPSVPAAAITTPVASPRVTAIAPPPTTAAKPAAPVAMPSVVCLNLQAAQNAIQAAGVWYSRSTDATGRGRMQLSDRNWIVVAQSPAPGVLIGEGDAVLSVVKTSEPNSCN